MPNNFLKRIVNTRQPRNVCDPDLLNLKTEIIKHIDDIKDKTQLRALFSNTTNSDEVKIKEFIARAQIVWICATLDYYLHKVQSICMFKIYNKQIAQTQYCNKINVPLNIVIDLSNGNSTTFIEGVYDSLKNYSYINMKSINSIASLIGVNIKQLAKIMYPTELNNNKAYKRLEKKLEEIFERRHIIVHKMDITDGGQQQVVTDILVDEYISTIEEFILKIHEGIENLF